LVQELTLTYEKLSNQARFILMIVKREISLSNRKRSDIVAELRKLEFRPFPKSAKAVVAADPDAMLESDADEEPSQAAAGSNSDYDYLLNMALSSLTREKVRTVIVEVKESRVDVENSS
jgi:DNA topoisomerase II